MEPIEAKKKLINIFGEKEVDEFMAFHERFPERDKELIAVTLVMYDAYGTEDTHEIFDALHINAPHVEDQIHDKEIKKLNEFRTKLWEYSFSEESPVSSIQMGINHIVFYPISTELGRRLLACMVATMWNPNNNDYFDVYKNLQFKSETMSSEVASSSDPTFSFILDHAGYEYSNPAFNRGNTAQELEHLHPKSGGSYHTHFHYHWNFSGLMAMMSVLKFVDKFIDEQDTTTKELYHHEVTHCIDAYAKHISETLLGLLPDYDYIDADSALVESMTQLTTLLTAIKKEGILNANIEPLDWSYKKCKTIVSQMKIQGNDVQSMLEVFLYDIKMYKQNQSLILENKLGLPDSDETVKELFNLACCLHHGASKIESLDEYELQQTIQNLSDSDDPSTKEEADLVAKELKIRDLRRVAGLSNRESLEEVRVKGKTGSPIDEPMKEYRERVADVVSTGFKFTQDALMSSQKSQPMVRTDTQKARAVLGDLKKEPTRRDRQAADLFLNPAITFSPVNPQDKERDPLDYYTIDSKYWKDIDAAVVHRTNNLNLPLMTTPSVLAIFKPGADINFSYLFRQLHRPMEKPSSIKAEMEKESSITVKAEWFNANTKPAHAASNANVFGGLGTLEIPQMETLDVPLHHANAVSPEFLSYYGAKLISNRDDIPYRDKLPVDLICAEYDFKQNYIPEYVLQTNQGGGVFVEKHEFRQFFTPLEPTCTGGIILGKEKSNGTIDFASFEIPYGYTLIIEPNVIHGDSFFKGKYAIALTEIVSADSVLIHKPDGNILNVTQTPAPLRRAHHDTLPVVDIKLLQQEIAQSFADMPKRLPKSISDEIQRYKNRIRPKDEMPGIEITNKYE